MEVPEDVQHLIHSFRPVHPTAQLIKAIPHEAFEALHTRFAKPCHCSREGKWSAVSRLAHMRCDFTSESCRSDYWRTGVSCCVGERFNEVHRAADEKRRPEFYAALRTLLDCVS